MLGTSMTKIYETYLNVQVGLNKQLITDNTLFPKGSFIILTQSDNTLAVNTSAESPDYSIITTNNYGVLTYSFNTLSLSNNQTTIKSYRFALKILLEVSTEMSVKSLSYSYPKQGSYGQVSLYSLDSVKQSSQNNIYRITG